MATGNPFYLLGNDDNDDPSQLIIAAEKLKIAAAATKKAPGQAAPPAKAGKLPAKPLPPQSVKEARNEGGRGGARGAEKAVVLGAVEGNSIGNLSTMTAHMADLLYHSRDLKKERLEIHLRDLWYCAQRGSFRGGRRGGNINDDVADGERNLRVFESHSGTGCQ